MPSPCREFRLRRVRPESACLACRAPHCRKARRLRWLHARARVRRAASPSCAAQRHPYAETCRSPTLIETCILPQTIDCWSCRDQDRSMTYLSFTMARGNIERSVRVMFESKWSVDAQDGGESCSRWMVEVEEKERRTARLYIRSSLLCATLVSTLRIFPERSTRPSSHCP